MRTLQFTLNDETLSCKEGETILQACQRVGVFVPTLCHYPEIQTQDFCQLCHVEVGPEKALKAACHTPVQEGMVVHTDSAWLRENHRRVLTPLLQSHPFDCPVCPKNGGCEIQDMVLLFRPPLSEPEASTAPQTHLQKGPLVLPVLSRCVGCQRCVALKDYYLGQSGRHETGRLQVISSVNALAETTFSGAMVDVCPAGALVPFPLGEKFSTWEKEGRPSLDVMDTFMPPVLLQVARDQVVGIQPQPAEDKTKTVWISDRTRFSYEGLHKNRIDQPFLRQGGELQAVSWGEAFHHIVEVLTEALPSQMGALSGELADTSTLYLMKQWLDLRGTPHRDCRPQGPPLSFKDRSSYLFNTPWEKVREADAVLLIGCTLEQDAPLLYLALSRLLLEKDVPVCCVGSFLAKGLTLRTPPLTSNNLEVLEDIRRGKHPFCETLQKSKKPLMIVGPHALSHPQGQGIHAASVDIAHLYDVDRESWEGANFLHAAPGAIGGMEVQFLPQPGGYNTDQILEQARRGKLRALYLLNVDEIDPHNFGDTFIIYQGTHWDRGAARARVILPGATFPEKNALYVNAEGRPQLIKPQIAPPGLAKEDWKIIRALSELTGTALPYVNHDEVVESLLQDHPFLKQREGSSGPTRAFHENPDGPWSSSPLAGTFPEKSPSLSKFFLSNPIGRASGLMQQAALHWRQVSASHEE